jgi:hypothetical protein
MPDTDPAADQSRRHARFHIHTGRILDWLATATDSMGRLFADTYAIDDSFRRGGGDMHDRIQMLVTQAHADQILTATGHHLQLWQVADEGFLLTVDAPTPPRLCSLHLTVDDLLPDKTSGSVAALAVLMAAGQVANQLLDEQTRSHAPRGTAPAAFLAHQPRHPVAGPPPGTNPADPTRTPRPHRGR